MTETELLQRLNALFDGDLSEADFLELEAELSVNPHARQVYLDQIAMTCLLEIEATAAAEETKSVSHFNCADAKRTRPGFEWSSKLPTASVLAVTTAIAVAAIAVFLSYRQFSAKDYLQDSHELLVKESQSVAQPEVASRVQSEVTSSGFAILSGQADAIWSNGQMLATGRIVPPGELHLLKGIVQFELFSGVAVIVEGEARFSILSPMELLVTQGKVRSRVPEPAEGFRIFTPRGEVVDLGTEFAIDINDVGTEIHVLAGEVEWHPDEGVMQTLMAGSATRSTAEGHVAFTADERKFVSPADIEHQLLERDVSRMQNWAKVSHSLHNDSRLIAYYQVTPQSLTARRLPNLAATESIKASEGAIVAAAGAMNRWGVPESGIDLSPPGSRIRLSIPGRYQSITLMCWLRIHSLDRWYNSLFLTDGHEVGEPHWQIMDDGRLFFSVKKRDRLGPHDPLFDKHVFYSPSIWTPERSGEWLMIATTYDIAAKLVTHYLNGEVLSQESIPDEYLVEDVTIGTASLGNWGLPKRDDPHFAVRNFNGSLDEFVLFRAALTADEVQSFYNESRP